MELQTADLFLSLKNVLIDHNKKLTIKKSMKVMFYSASPQILEPDVPLNLLLKMEKNVFPLSVSNIFSVAAASGSLF